MGRQWRRRRRGQSVRQIEPGRLIRRYALARARATLTITTPSSKARRDESSADAAGIGWLEDFQIGEMESVGDTFP